MYNKLKTDINNLRRVEPVIEIKRTAPKSKPEQTKRKEYTKANVFREQDIIESHRLSELLEARSKCDFLYQVGPGAAEQERLKRWKDWFTLSALMIQSLVNFAHQKISAPWAITLTKGNYVLWKIDETLDIQGIRDERKKPEARWFVE